MEITPKQQKKIDRANASTKPPSECPCCGGKLFRMRQYGKTWYECLNLITRVTGNLYSGSGQQACGYKWNYPKNRNEKA